MLNDGVMPPNQCLGAFPDLLTSKILLIKGLTVQTSGLHLNLHCTDAQCDFCHWTYERERERLIRKINDIVAAKHCHSSLSYSKLQYYVTQDVYTSYA